MILQNEELILYNFLNHFRTEPESAAHSLEEKLNKKDIKNSKDMAMISNIKKNSCLPAFKLSTSLNKLAKNKISLINSNCDDKETDEEREKRFNINLKGFLHVYEIAVDLDMSNLELDFFSLEKFPKSETFFMLYDKTYNYIGLEARQLEGDVFKVVFCLADNVFDEDNTPLDSRIVEAINVFRLAPRRKIDELLSINGNKEFIKDVQEFTKRLSCNALPPLKREKILDEIASDVYSKYKANEFSNPSDEKYLREIAQKTISNFERIHCAILKDVDNANTAINLMLANPKEKLENLIFTRKNVNGKSMRHIGVYYENMGKKNSLIIITLDTFIEGSSKTFHSIFQEELNRLRRSPDTFSGDLTIYLNDIQNKSYQSNLIKNVKELKKSIKVQNILPEIQNNVHLNRACQDYIYHTNDKDLLYREEDDLLLERLNLYISGHTKAKLFVGYFSKPEKFITSLLVSDNDKSNESRKSLLDEDFRYFGCFQTLLNEKKITILILANNVEERIQYSIEEESLLMCNIARENPRILCKFVSDYINNLTEKISQNTISKKKKNNEDLENQIEYCKYLNFYLKTCRTQTKFNFNELLKEPINQKLTNNDMEFNEDSLRLFLKDYINNAYYCLMISGGVLKEDYFIDNDDNEIFLAGKFLVRNFVENREIDMAKRFFNFALNEINIGYNKNVESLIIMICDNASERLKLEIPADFVQTVNRPNFTIDEINQLRNDFSKFDVLDRKFVRPDTILCFMSNNEKTILNNPIYYYSFKKLNTVENNEEGINVNQFMDAVSETISQFERRDWENLFKLVTKKSKSKQFDKVHFFNLLKRLGYQMGESEANEVFDRLNLDSGIITLNDFLNFMIISEKKEV